MKKILLSAGLFLTLFSCQNEETLNTNPDGQAVAERGCATYEVLQAQLAADPSLAIRMNQIEEFTQKAKLTNKLVNGKIVIPVVVNVLYRTAAENISDAQIQSQITVLNKDFTATNSDFSSTPSLFSGVAANVGITFELVAINRKSTTKTSWSSTDRQNNTMKKSTSGGINPTSPSTNLNIWIVSSMPSTGGSILGYAQFPGGSLSTDGVVLAHTCTGTIGTASAPFNLGRTATHEVGHWMNLRHIWGDANCGSDLVADTPTHNAANTGVPTYPHLSTCTGTPVEMTMNYMDYTDDRGMYMFTNGQKARMAALFVSGGARSAFGI